ncbi:MAG: DUF370 domain-containing protein [Calditrichaeota bacterium]|nr:DUF370 domain-containing protein [Calditrichota bacterium]
MISVGFRNYVAVDRIVAIVVPESRPIRGMISGARERGMLVDATMGRRTKAVVVTDSGHVILSANSVETLVSRVESYYRQLAAGTEEAD